MGIFGKIVSSYRQLKSSVNTFADTAVQVTSDLEQGAQFAQAAYKDVSGTIKGISGYWQANKNDIIDRLAEYCKDEIKTYVNRQAPIASIAARPGHSASATPVASAPSQSSGTTPPVSSQAPVAPASSVYSTRPQATPQAAPQASPQGKKVEQASLEDIARPGAMQEAANAVASAIDSLGKALENYGRNYQIDINMYDSPVFKHLSVKSDARSTLEAIAAGPKKNEQCEIKPAYSAPECVLNLYNSGLKTNDIRRQASRQGHSVSAYNEVLSLVAQAIQSGKSYGRDKFNSRIASELGLMPEITSAYAGGASYDSIKKLVAEKAGGMRISESSIKRLARRAEAKQKAA